MVGFILLTFECSKSVSQIKLVLDESLLDELKQQHARWSMNTS